MLDEQELIEAYILIPTFHPSGFKYIVQVQLVENLGQGGRCVTKSRSASMNRATADLWIFCCPLPPSQRNSAHGRGTWNTLDQQAANDTLDAGAKTLTVDYSPPTCIHSRPCMPLGRHRQRDPRHVFQRESPSLRPYRKLAPDRDIVLADPLPRSLRCITAATSALLEPRRVDTCRTRSSAPSYASQFAHEPFCRL